MAHIGKDYYEDLTAESFGHILDELVSGRVPTPGSQNGRYASEPKSGLTSLTDHEAGRAPHNAAVALALELGDTVKRIDGSEVPISTPWLGKNKTPPRPAPPKNTPHAPNPAAPSEGVGAKPDLLDKPRHDGPDDLKKIKGVGPKLEKLLNQVGVYHFDQIAGWSKDEVAWADENLVGFKGRVSRDNWVAQARKLAQGG